MRVADKLPMFGKRKSSSVLVGTASKQLKLVPNSSEQSKDPKKELSKELSKWSKDLPSLDELALAAVVVSAVPAQHRRLLRDAVAQLDLSLFKPLKTQWGESKRLQATFGAEDCLIKHYNFSRLDNPILKATGNLLTLLEQAAQQLQESPKLSSCTSTITPKAPQPGAQRTKTTRAALTKSTQLSGTRLEVQLLFTCGLAGRKDDQEPAWSLTKARAT